MASEDVLRKLKELEDEIEYSALPSEEVRAPVSIFSPRCDPVDRASVSSRHSQSPAPQDTSVLSKDDKQLWSHVRHLETQLEFIASARSPPAPASPLKGSAPYTAGLAHTMSNLAAPLGSDSDLAGVPASSPLRKKTTKRTTVENAWDLRLNIGMEVSKWFGHEDQSSRGDRLAKDLAHEPASLHYGEVMAVDQRARTIEAVTNISLQLERTRAKWQASLADLRPAFAAAQGDTRTLDDLQTRLEERNASFVTKVDALLARLSGESDVTGENERKARTIEKLDSQMEDAVQVIKHQVDKIAETEAELRQRNRRVEELEEKWLETDGERASQQEQAQDLTMEVASSAARVNDLQHHIDHLNQQAAKAEALRAAVAAEAADTHIELIHALEELASERENARVQAEERKTYDARIRELEDDLSRKNARTLELEQWNAREAASNQSHKLKDISHQKWRDNVTRVNETLVNENGSLKYQLNDAHADKKAAEDEARRLKAEVDDLRVQLEELARDHRSVSEMNDTMKVQLEQLSVLRLDKHDQDKKILELRRVVEDLRSRAGAPIVSPVPAAGVPGGVGHTGDVGTSDILAQPDDGRDELRTKLSECTARLEDALDLVDDKRRENEVLTTKLSSYSDEMTKEIRGHTKMKAENRALSSQLDRSRASAVYAEAEDLKGSVDALQRQVLELTAERDVLREELQRLKAFLEEQHHFHTFDLRFNPSPLPRPSSKSRSESPRSTLASPKVG